MNLCKQVLVPNDLFMRWLHHNVNINREMVQRIYLENKLIYTVR